MGNGANALVYRSSPQTGGDVEQGQRKLVVHPLKRLDKAVKRSLCPLESGLTAPSTKYLRELFGQPEESVKVPLVALHIADPVGKPRWRSAMCSMIMQGIFVRSSVVFTSQTTLSSILPSLNRLNSALSPHNSRKARVPGESVSAAGGPRSTRRNASGRIQVQANINVGERSRPRWPDSRDGSSSRGPRPQ